MEEEIRKAFSFEKKSPEFYSPLALAYMGDGVYELVIRTMLLLKGNANASRLHKAAVNYVSAKAQAGIVGIIFDELDDEEKAVYNRGRNAKPKSTAKNASLADYHAATGFEALIGYLYLKDRFDRILYLIKKGISHEG